MSDTPLDVALDLARQLKDVAKENVGSFVDCVKHYGETGDATYEVDVPLENHVEEYFSNLGLSCTVMTEDRGSLHYGADPEWIFLIDPLDGSRNIRRSLPFYCCSIAVYPKSATDLSQAVCAVIERFDADEEFVGLRGGKPTLNGNEIRPSIKETLEDSVACIGSHFAATMQFYSRPLSLLSEKVKRQERGIWVKCYGATALELAYLACGRIDFLFEGRLAGGFNATPKTYDVAAGILLCETSGAVLEYGSQSLPERLPIDPNVKVQALGAGNRRLFNILSNTLQ